jgi:hypothetical protein
LISEEDERGRRKCTGLLGFAPTAGARAWRATSLATRRSISGGRARVKRGCILAVDDALTWVDEGIYAGGGEQLPATWAGFAEQTGITAVVHLRPGRPAVFHGRAPERFLWLPLVDENEATGSDRLLAAAFVAGCLAEGRKVLLHSSLGRHRIRWVYVAYRILRGSSPQAALRRASRRPWMSPYATDLSAWEAFAAASKGSGA